MHKLPGDYIITYDKKFIEQHEDSSDFEDNCIPIVASKNGNHRLMSGEKHKNRTRNSMQHYYKPTNPYIDCDEYPVKLKKAKNTLDYKTYNLEMQEPKIKRNEKSDRRPKSTKIDYNKGDEIKTVTSKLSVIKHKVIPCISNIFKWSINSTKHKSVIEENKHADNCCQHCSSCERRRTRKLYRKNYAVQPVYVIEGNAHRTTGTFCPQKKAEEQNRNQIINTKNQYSSTVSSSSESEIQSVQERQHQVEKFRRRLKTEILNEHLKYKQYHKKKTQNIQYPSKDHKTPYQVFTTYDSKTANVPSNSKVCDSDRVPESSSSFWDYLFDKTSKKYQTQRLELSKPCQCGSSQKLVCSPEACHQTKVDTVQHQKLPLSTVCKNYRASAMKNLCDCKKKFEQQQQAYAERELASNQLDERVINCKPKDVGCHSQNQASSGNIVPQNAPSSIILRSKTEKMDSSNIKVTCKCHVKPKSSPQTTSKALNTPSLEQDVTPNLEHDAKPCQENHDALTKSLANKYNGEILCIHNPPCILINGCLNLPPQKESPALELWPVTTINEQNSYGHKEKSFCEQCCQYQVPCVEVHKNSYDHKTEKKIQSICDHDPPCEVVRGCYKPKYDPNLQNSCVHVPMCEKIPECIVGNKNGKCCVHRPKCRDIPICSRNYVILTAREDIGTQMNPEAKGNMTVCRHEPPCIKIPKCLGRTMCGSLVSVDAIPDCMHNPTCDLIPACCRKTAKTMVSVTSQYPNSCRIT